LIVRWPFKGLVLGPLPSLEPEGRAGVVSCWVILDKEAKKEKKKRNFRGRRWRNSTEPEKTKK